MVFVGAVMQSVGVDGIAPNQLRNAEPLTTLRLSAAELDTASVLQQLDLQLSDDADDNGTVQVIVAFDGDHPVTSGQYLPMNEAQAAPSISVETSATSSDERYTYVLIDIDAPDPKAPTHAPFLHYILAGLTSGKQNEQQVVVVPYYPVTPPVGEHRYVSLLFRQQEGGDPDAPDADLTAKRTNFDVAGFAKEHNLDLVATSIFLSHPAAQDD
ncbi:unnamed protein product [Phytophthora lilii]|uniref:Unnamed protein product n=1 Tax=Phytophthora lilii TaxID=2077276 RepID=A0A9W6WSA2_9STRA|nr:unnamed protein product [Phytophthora lilii]